MKLLNSRTQCLLNLLIYTSYKYSEKKKKKNLSSLSEQCSKVISDSDNNK
jgi:hypothetical protein